MEGKVRSAKVDCEEDRVSCGRLGIREYPTLRLYLAPDSFFPIEVEDPAQMLKRVKQIIKEAEHTEHDEL